MWVMLSGRRQFVLRMCLHTVYTHEELPVFVYDQISANRNILWSLFYKTFLQIIILYTVTVYTEQFNCVQLLDK